MNRLKRLSQGILRRRYPAVLIGLGCLLSLPSLLNGILADDLHIRACVLEHELVDGMAGNCWGPFTFLHGDPEQNRRLTDRGLLPWWTDLDCRAAFMRPLTALTHMADYRLWPRWPVLMHVQSLLWFALLIWAVAVFYRRVMSRRAPAWTAALAALLFTLDDTHAFPVGWLANRNSLLAGLFVVLTLIAYDRWRADGWRPGAYLAPLGLLAGLLAKEAAVCAGAYLLAYALFLDRGRPQRRWLALLPCLLVGVAWYAVYRALGFGLAGSDIYADPANDPLRFGRNVLLHGPILLLGQWGFPGADLYNLASVSARHVLWLWAVGFLGLLGLVLAPLVARSTLARFWTLGMLLSLLPACIPFPNDRLLTFVGLGAIGLLTEFLGGFSEEAAWLPRSTVWRRGARAMAWLLVVIHVALAPVLFLVSSSFPGLLARRSARLMATYPDDPKLANQTTVVVNEIVFATRALIQLRYDQGRPPPRRALCLNSAASPAIVHRCDATTLAVRPRGGYLRPSGCWPDDAEPAPPVHLLYLMQLLDRLPRDQRRPLQLGEQIELTDATVEITAMTDDGRPAEATFRFRVPLEDPSLRWLRMTPRGWVPITPPKIGETVEYPL
ncbi:MAG: hypothetical protein JXB62_06410 [Pirellulales bacterium]|nr:hypothetical protein [Pirellulales bacterium]